MKKLLAVHDGCGGGNAGLVANQAGDEAGAR